MTPEFSTNPLGRILVVDDAGDVRAILVEFLRALGFEVEEALDGAAGLAAIQACHDYQAALVDVTMPGLNGNELLKHIRMESPGTKVILMSGYSEEEATDPGSLPPDTFLGKPFSLKQLESAVRRVLAA